MLAGSFKLDEVGIETDGLSREPGEEVDGVGGEQRKNEINQGKENHHDEKTETDVLNDVVNGLWFHGLLSKSLDRARV